MDQDTHNSASLYDNEKNKIEQHCNAALEKIFNQDRTATNFSSKPISKEKLKDLYNFLKMGPTSGNCSPLRIIFLMSDDAKNKIKSSLSVGNVERAMKAPVIAILAYDPLFFENLPKLSRIEGLRDWFAADVDLSEETAFRNGTLQAGYFILAARLLGLSILPMSGFDAPSIEEKLFEGQNWRINFVAAIGYQDIVKDMVPREPRLSFDEACMCL